MAMLLFKIVGGEVIPEIEMPESATILDLKKKIETILNVVVVRQTLKFNNQLLMNDQIIGHCNFRESATIVLHVKPLAGQPKFNILVKNKYDEVLLLNVRETTLVAELKRKIGKRWFLSSECLTLHHLDMEMDDDFPLSAYYVCEGSKVEVTYYSH